MKKRLIGPLTVLALCALALLSPMAGTASASPWTDYVDDIVRQLTKLGRPTTQPIIERSRTVLEPAAGVAGDNKTQFDKIARAACKINRIQHRGGSIADALLDLTPAEQSAAIRQSEVYTDQQTYDENGYYIVKIFCNSLR